MPQMFRCLVRAALVAVIALGMAGCGDSDPTMEDVLAGTWQLTLLPSGTKTLLIETEKGWFGSSLIWKCGGGNLLPFSDDPREVKVELHRSPTGAPTGLIYMACLGSHRFGHHVDALFDGDDRMTGRITFQENRGNKTVGPIWVVTSVVLFHGVRTSGPAH